MNVESLYFPYNTRILIFLKGVHYVSNIDNNLNTIKKIDVTKVTEINIDEELVESTIKDSEEEGIQVNVSCN